MIALLGFTGGKISLFGDNAYDGMANIAVTYVTYKIPPAMPGVFYLKPIFESLFLQFISGKYFVLAEVELTSGSES